MFLWTGVYKLWDWPYTVWYNTFLRQAINQLYVIIHFNQNACPILDEAISKAELTVAELELQINKLKTEEAGMKDALLKMQALNEGLGQDKIELNKIIMQVCQNIHLFLLHINMTLVSIKF